MSENRRFGFGIVLAFIAYFLGAAILDFNPALGLLGLLFKGWVYASIIAIPFLVIALLCGRWR